MMSQFSDEMHSLINSIHTAPDGLKFLGVDILLAKNNSESQAALLSILDLLQEYPEVYWHTINGLDKQSVIDGTTYYQEALMQETNKDNHYLQLSAMSHIHGLGHSRVIRVLSECLIYQKNEQLFQSMLSMLAGSNSEIALYRMVEIIRYHPNYAVRRLTTRQLVYHFESDVLIPIALGLIYTETVDADSKNTVINLFWQCIIQGKISGYKQQVISALEYCLYSLPDSAVGCFRCLKEIDTPEAEIVLNQWDIHKKHHEIRFFR